MWHIEQPNASLRARNLQCEIELTSPQNGLQNTFAYQEVLAANQFIQLNLGLNKETVTEAYQRGNDLIALYSSQQQRKATPQLYWRSLEQENAAGIETIISLQTDLLASRCPIHSVTKLNDTLAAQALTSTQKWVDVEEAKEVRAILVQLSPALTYLEIVHPTDPMDTKIQRDGASLSWEHIVLDLRLEKGVIRRARLQSWWIQNDSEQSLANRLVDSFVASAPPLTT